ncbi:MAG: geranylgeranyl reductase family protein [Desulfatibacillaceae bacterium]
MPVENVVIAGAGPAGLTAATLLERAGVHVVVLEKSGTPANKPCGGGLTPRARMLLDEMDMPCVSGYDVPTVEANAPPWHYNTFTARGPLIRVVDRGEFNRSLWANAVARGVTILRRKVLGVSHGPGGFAVRTDDGVFHCDVVIGADGPTSRVLRSLGGRIHKHGGAYMYERVETDRYAGRVVFDGRAEPPGYGWVFATGPDTVNAGIYLTHGSNGHSPKQLLEDYARDRLGFVPDAPVVGGSIPWGGATLPEPAPPVLLAGDAGGFTDPMTGEGIYHALATGRAAARACAAVGPAGVRREFFRLTRFFRLNVAFLRWFCPTAYPHVAGGARLLRLPLFHRVVTEGFLRGYTTSQCLARLPQLYWSSWRGQYLAGHEHTAGMPLAAYSGRLNPVRGK